MRLADLTLAEKVKLSQQERNEALEEALAKAGGGKERGIRLPSGLKVKLRRTPLSQILGGNPLNPDGAPVDDELMKMLKVTRG